jgi:hypothetical protein
MCTVTFLPLSSSDFILTSNRDEQISRDTFPPKIYVENNVEMLFPKDKLAGGTWIGISKKNRLVCVLNGAFKKHKRKDNYLKSRGLIAKELLQCINVENSINQLNLTGIEPFTMVIADWNENPVKLYEFVWDENNKQLSLLKNEPKIWSSSTLYSDEIKEVRENWFNDWISKNDSNFYEIMEFHQSEIGDKEQSILMKRSYVETISITQIKKIGTKITMFYKNVLNNSIYEHNF